MAQWPQDLFVKAARAVWERFVGIRVPNPLDFLGFIADDLGERRKAIAALHALQKAASVPSLTYDSQIGASLRICASEKDRANFGQHS